jgi:glycine/D-amino acid oxidase-like deaminating enzyme
MTAKPYDVVIIGGGLLGAGVGAALADAGKSVMLLESREKGHAEGSSHGHSRVIRTLSSEIPVFSDMAKDALATMRALELSHRGLVTDVQAVFICTKGSAAYRGLKAADPDASELAPDEAFAEYRLKLKEDEVGILDRTSAIFDPAALLDVFYGKLLGSSGAVRFGTEAKEWNAGADGVTVRTDTEPVIQGDRLVLAAGAWLPQLLARGPVDAEVRRCLSGIIERIPLFYFDYPDNFMPLIPVTVLDNGHPDMYAMPEYDPAVIRGKANDPPAPSYLKVGFHKGHEVGKPEDVRPASGDEEYFATQYMEERLGRKLSLRKTSTCLYAMPPALKVPGDDTPYKELPLLGPLPGTPGVYLAAYGAGICAKHAIPLGRQLSCVLQGENAPYELRPLDPEHRMHLKQRREALPRS